MVKYRPAKTEFPHDVILYYGDISRDGYEAITAECLQRKLHDTAYLVLATYGGDPHAGFRIARCLRHHYGAFKILVLDHCKSAGTLIAIGADEVIIADRGELGPLDIQLSKPDELLEQSSGMDIPQALDFLKQQTKATLSDLLWEIRVNRRLSTKVAAELASKLTSAMFHPIYAQIDPVKLGETSRANAIGFEYGKRLNQVANNLKPNALVKLITHYPSHSFVIDRKEACDLFQRVRCPNEAELSLLQHVYGLGHRIYNSVPVVSNLNCVEVSDEHAELPVPQSDEPGAGALSDAGGSQQGATGGQPSVGAPDAKPARRKRVKPSPEQEIPSAHV